MQEEGLHRYWFNTWHYSFSMLRLQDFDPFGTFECLELSCSQRDALSMTYPR